LAIKVRFLVSWQLYKALWPGPIIERGAIVLNPHKGQWNLSFVYISHIEGGIFMAKRRGNPNWGKPEPIGPVIPTVTEFEQVVREYKLTPDQYLRSTRLREWARRNKNSKYIPEPLLEAWGFEIESTL
jgi:hypothetical protein